MDSSKAKRREGVHACAGRRSRHRSKKEEADFRRNGGNPVKKLLLD
ncbi:MAG TPA: hypothetical protein VF800_07455 [Telluria sp.]|jgi:hypothetical protein